jgi:hypothetical protein
MTTPWNLPVFVRFPCVDMPPPRTPGAASERIASLISSDVSVFPDRVIVRVGLRIVLFEACSALTRVAACTLALSANL